MITISLDEHGTFEKNNKKDAPFIGGIIYDDGGNKNDSTEEEERIKLYLQAVCLEVEKDLNQKVKFPRNLHLDPKISDGREKQREEKIVKRVKEKIDETLPGFLQNGTCYSKDNEKAEELNNKPQRRGKYHVFCYCYNRYKEPESKSKNKITREDYAGNLYIRMAEEVVGRLILHNPVIRSVEEVSFDPAQRSVFVDEGSSQAGEFKKLGYRRNKWESEQVSFVVTDSDVYRTALERDMMNSGKDEIPFAYFGTRSVCYDECNGCKKKDKDKCGINKRSMSFLYLADFVCSVLGFHLDTGSPEALIKELKSRADNCTGRTDSLVFAYDDVDFLFKRAWEKLEEKEYFEALRLVHQGEKSDSPYASYYADVWFERIRERMRESKDMGAFEEALNKGFLLTRSNNLKQDELLDIYKMFEEMLGNMNLDDAKDASALYNLYEAGITAYSHVADSAHARECFEKCIKYAKFVDTERYLRTRNKMVVFLADSFRSDVALKIAEENIKFHKKLLEFRASVLDVETTPANYGRALSQEGQILAFLRKPEAEGAFLKALKQFEEGSADYRITQSYLLHYYIETGETDKYDRLSLSYFGGKEKPLDQFAYILGKSEEGEKSDYSMKFALYVFVKGLYVFHRDEITADSDLVKKLCDIRTAIDKKAGKTGTAQMEDHPWEIIYKYLALIAQRLGQTDQAEKYKQEIRKSLNNTPDNTDTTMLTAICAFGEMEYARAAGEREEEKERFDELRSIFKYKYKEIDENIDWSNPETAYAGLKEKYLNYMYS